MAGTSKSHSNYKTISEVLDMCPIRIKEYVNVYGIVKSVVAKNLDILVTLIDERKEMFVYMLKPSDANRYPKFEPGDVLRIKDLILDPQSKCKLVYDSKTLVVFPSFSDINGVEVVHLNKTTIALESIDIERRRALENCLNAKLYKLSINSLLSSGYIDLVAQVISIQFIDRKGVFWIWDGSFPPDHFFTPRLHQIFNGSYEPYLMPICETKAICLTVWDEHSISLANKIKPGDFIVAFNLKICEMKNYSGRYELMLNSGFDHGKWIRIIHSNSHLCLKLKRRIESLNLNDDRPQKNILCLSDSEPEFSQSDIEGF